MKRIPFASFDADKFFYSGKIETVKHSKNVRYINAWASFDTETCADAHAGYIVFWTACLQYQGRTVTVYGRTADDACRFFDSLSCALSLSESRRLPVYVHNFSYDYVFMRNFLLESFGQPVASLAVKTHRYITMTFANGIEFKDSYILSQSSLEKWAHDLKAPVTKAAGQWDYEKHRTPETELTDAEIDYACRDAETLVLCVQLKAAQGGYGVGSIPLTATGFARNDARAAAFDAGWKDRVHALDMSLPLYNRCRDTFWGGMTHANRFQLARVLHDVTSYDFASSYPAVMCTEKFPASAWLRAHYSMEAMQRDAPDYCFLFDLLLLDAHIKRGHPMPCISQSKCVHADSGAVWDNGKLISAEVVVIPCTEVDALLYLSVYDYSAAEIGLLEADGSYSRGDVYTCEKDYLPRWFTDSIQKYFLNKTTKKNSDPQTYQFNKGLLNSLYGMCSQKIIREEIKEDFTAADNEWKITEPDNPQAVLNSHYAKYNYFLPYQWSLYVTGYARQRLFKLGQCCGEWLYCDTDSVKGRRWDIAAVERYNEEIRRKNAERGVLPVEFNGRVYEMGIAEHDADYSEFITLGAKRYCVRHAVSGQLEITVAGVPKRGVQVLGNNIYLFARGLIFHDTGKLIPEYHTRPQITDEIIDGARVRVGSWINLVSADYALDMADRFDTLLDLPEQIPI